MHEDSGPGQLRAGQVPGQPVAAGYDPERFRDAGHRLIDELADYLATAMRGGEAMSVLPVVDPEEMLGRVDAEFPPHPADDLVEMLSRVVAHSNHMHHPGYIGHQVASVLPQAALAELVSALLNNGMAIYEMGQMHTAMERRVIAFLASKLGFASSADGVLTNGGSVGNLTALLAARQAKAGHDVWTDGQRERYAVLVSDQAHYCIARSVQLMGWGKHGAWLVPTDEKFRIRPDALSDAKSAAEAEGRRVIAVCASCCSTATGSIDSLPDIAEFCDREDLWLHVDGAHGASLAMSSTHRGKLEGIERADSVVWDLHKMMLLPALVTAVVFRDGRRSYEAFAQEAGYLFDSSAGYEWFNIGKRTLECTKRGLGVTAYTSLRANGTALFEGVVDTLVALAIEFADMLERSDDFDLAIRPEVNIVCFRHRVDRVVDLDAHQERIRRRILADGRFYIVQTDLRGETWLRVTLMNPLTTRDHLRALLDEIRTAGAS